MKKIKVKEEQFYINIKPLSINLAFQGRRFKTQKYKDWQTEFLWKLKKKKIKKIEGEIGVNISWATKNAKRADIDNPIKQILDTLKDGGAIEDDRFIWEMRIRKYKLLKDDKDWIKIHIYPLKIKTI